MLISMFKISPPFNFLSSGTPQKVQLNLDISTYPKIHIVFNNFLLIDRNPAGMSVSLVVKS